MSHTSVLNCPEPASAPLTGCDPVLLEPCQDSLELKTLVLSAGRHQLGSDSHCDVHLPIPGIAPRHCLIVVGPRRCIIKALCPLTWLNDSVVRESALHDGDRLVIGPVEWRVRISHTTALGPKGDSEIDDTKESPLHLRPVPRPENAPAHHAPWSPEHPPSLAQQRAYLAELSESLAAREHELCARETEVRCHWDELQNTWRAAHDYDRLVRAERAAIAGEREQLESEQNSLRSLRQELDELRAALDRRAAELHEQQQNLQQQRDELAHEAARLRGDADRRGEELQRERETLDRRSAELQVAQSECCARLRRLEESEQQIMQRATQVETAAGELHRRLRELQASVGVLLGWPDHMTETPSCSASDAADEAGRSAAGQEPGDNLDAAELQAQWAALAAAREALQRDRQELFQQIREFAAVRNGGAAPGEIHETEIAPQAEQHDGVDGGIRLHLTDPMDSFASEEREVCASSGPADERRMHDREWTGDAEESEASSLGPVDASALQSVDRADEYGTPLADEADRESLISGYVDTAAAIDESDPPCESAHEKGGSWAESANQGVLSLRAHLAELFGISRAPRDVEAEPHHAEEVVEPLEALETTICAQSTDRAESTPADAALGSPQEAAPTPDTGSARQGESSGTAAAPSAVPEDDSIAAYMEQLLARSKSKIRVPDDLMDGGSGSGSRPGITVPSQLAGEAATPVAGGSSPSLKAIAPEDKEAIRANLDSFRELANISARSAVAKHKSEKLQTIVKIKFLVLLTAVGLVLLLSAADWLSAASYLPYTVAAGLAAVVMAADVVRTVLAISRWKSVESAGEWEADAQAAEPSHAAEEAPPPRTTINLVRPLPLSAAPASPREQLRVDADADKSLD